MGIKTVLHLVAESTWKVQFGLNCIVPSQNPIFDELLPILK